MALFSTSKDNEQPMAKQGNAPAPNHVNIIAEGTVFEGTVQADSDVRVSGRVIGKLEVKGRAVVAAEGAVEGEITATNANILGEVKGDLIIAERLLLGVSARVHGTIKTGRFIVEEGATFNGECQMGQTGQIRKKAAERPEAKVPRMPGLPRDNRPGEAEAAPAKAALPDERLTPKF